jgi:hypothetical protein
MNDVKFAGRLLLMAVLATNFVACKGAQPTVAPAGNVPVASESTLIPAAPAVSQPAMAPATTVATTDTIPAAVVQGDAAVAQYLGKFSADLATAGSKVTLELTPDMSAVMTTESAGKPAVVGKGVWSASGPSVAIVLNSRDGQPTADTMTFELKDGALNGMSFDKAVYGASLVLKKQ